MGDQPLLLDLFACAGGAGTGYARAGFRVVGVDLDPRPLRHNPHECYEGDALEVLDTLLVGERWQGYALSDFAVIHASPPCQGYSRSRHIHSKSERRYMYPLLIAPTRARLERTGLPWIVENVEGASSEMPDAIMLCGTSFGLRTWRHRLFASSHLLYAAGPCHHQAGDISVRRKHAEYIGISSGVTSRDATGRERKRPKTATAAAQAKAAMGIDWMTTEELGEAIPPAYTAWLGAQLLTVVLHSREAA